MDFLQEQASDAYTGVKWSVGIGSFIIGSLIVLAGSAIILAAYYSGYFSAVRL